MNSNEAEFSNTPGRIALWMGPLIGPLAWLIDLQASFSADRWSCENGTAAPLHWATIICLMVTLGGVWLTWRQWSHAGKQWPGEEAGVMPRSRFVSFVGLCVNLIFVLAILAQSVPKWMLSPCQ